MSYDLTYDEWQAKLDNTYTRLKPRPTPMRPVHDRLIYSTEHFVVMEANTTSCNHTRRGKKLALIEMANGVDGKPPTRIDPRLKSIRQIIQVREVINLRHPRAVSMYRRWWQELRDLADKCERLYPCHFLVKGVGYQPPAHLLDPCSSTEG